MQGANGITEMYAEMDGSIMFFTKKKVAVAPYVTLLAEFQI